MANITEGRILAQEYCNQYPEINSTNLSKMLRTEYPDIYKSAEGARSTVRKCRGTHGKLHRDAAANRTCFVGEDALAESKGIFKPKILMFDIETAPSMAYVWGMFKIFVQPSMLIESGKILCYAGKWLGEDDIYYDSIKNDIPHSRALNTLKKAVGKILKFTGFEVLWNILVFYSTSDKRLCNTLYSLFDEADIVVGHNGQAFDVHTMNAWWVKHGFAPPSPYKIVDTLKIAKNEFRFPRNKLESIAKFLERGKKTSHEGFELWVKCMAKGKDAWAKMEEYNIQDINLLEEIYMIIRAWDRKHPNVALLYDDFETRCNVCGSTDMTQIKSKMSQTNVSLFPSYRCGNCKKVMRGRKRENPDNPKHSKTNGIPKKKVLMAHSL